jgi:hypothetical protein
LFPTISVSGGGGGRLLPRPPRTKTIFIARHGEGSHSHVVENRLYWDARAYLAARNDVDAMDQLCLSVGSLAAGPRCCSSSWSPWCPGTR